MQGHTHEPAALTAGMKPKHPLKTLVKKRKEDENGGVHNDIRR